MKLQAWLSENNRSAAWLAEETKLSAPYVSRLIAGERTPSIDTCAKIAAATGGDVTVLDFMPEPPKRKHPKQREVSRRAA